MQEQPRVGGIQDEITLLRRRVLELESEQLRQQKNEKRLQLANSIMSEGLWEWDLRKLRIWWNDVYERLYGPRPSAAERGIKWWMERIHPEDRDRVLRIVQGARDGSDDGWTCEYRFRRRDGTYAFVLDRALIFRDSRGKAVRILGTTLDLTGHGSALQDMEEINRRKDQFLAIVTHELRNPVNAIAGWVALLRTRTLDSATQARALEVIDQNAKLEARLIEDLLDFSRILTGKLNVELKRLDFAALIRCSVESSIPLAAAKGVCLTSDLEDPGDVLGDSHRLRQIVENLISNALKFTPTGGHIEVMLAPAGKCARLVIRDSGVGIKPDMLPHIFDQFWQADKSPTRDAGLGLGLAITEHLVELHGGTIKIESDGEGCGVTAKVELPLAAGKRNKWISKSVRSLFRKT